jgi:5-hydroxyisourate hydrolase
VSLSTHVLDTARGEPARGLRVRLDRAERPDTAAPGPPRWAPVADGVTDADGRLRGWVPPGRWGAGRYRLVFDTGGYLGAQAFFPQVTVEFTVTDPGAAHHVPLLLGPYSYTTYRGS